MKNLLFILLYCSGGGWIQGPPSEDTVVITYKTEFRIRKNQDYRKTESVKLFIGPKGSVFVDQKFLLFHQLAKKNISPSEKTRELAMIGMPYFRFYLVKNYEEGSTLFIEEHLNRQYNAYQKPTMSTENWTIADDKDSTIFGLKTYKAECLFSGRKWTAWFTPEIPVSDGPYKFSGLPGLILKLESADGDYSFHISDVQRQAAPEELPFLPDYHVISESRFKEIQQIMLDNPFAQVQSKGGKIEGDITVDNKVMSQEEYLLFLKKDRENEVLLEKE